MAYAQTHQQQPDFFAQDVNSNTLSCHSVGLKWQDRKVSLRCVTLTIFQQKKN